MNSKLKFAPHRAGRYSRAGAGHLDNLVPRRRGGCSARERRAYPGPGLRNARRVTVERAGAGRVRRSRRTHDGHAGHRRRHRHALRAQQRGRLWR